MAEHDQNLKRVLQRLSEANATVRQDKCIIGQPMVEFNGHRISAQGILPLKSNIDAVLRMTPPTDQKQLIRFLSTANYYLKFVQGFAELCEPLRQLLRKDVVWNWSSDCQHSFDQLKERLISAPVLAHFDISASTYLTCDASGTAIGACLSQRSRHDGIERPVAFISRALSPAERKYSATEREALACLWACERLDFYLYGRHFTLITDHAALTSLLAPTGTGHKPLRLHRWYDRLWKYNFTPVYRRGTDNAVADCLSRSYSVNDVTAEVTSSAEASDIDDDNDLVQTVFGNGTTAAVTLQELQQATRMDPVLCEVIKYVTDGWPSSKQSVTPAARVFFDMREEMSVIQSGSCLVRGQRLVIPATLQPTMLNLAHEGHPGIVRMKRKCRDTIYWPGMDMDIERYVRNCAACVISGKSVRPSAGPLIPIQLPKGPWRKLSLDFAGEFIAAPVHQRYIIVAMDYFTKWPEVTVCGQPTTKAVIDFLTALFDRFGLVEEICTDNGVQFCSLEFQEFLQKHNIRHSKSSLYAPQTQGEVERFNRVIKEGIRAALAEGKSFITGLRQSVAAYRTTHNSTTGYTPAELMFTFPANTPLTQLHEQALVKDSTGQQSADKQQEVRRRVHFSQQKMQATHDKRHHVKRPLFKAGDLIRIKLPSIPHKLAPAYSEQRRVRRAAGNTVWTDDGKKWNVRRCILSRSSIKHRHSALSTETAVGDPPPEQRKDKEASRRTAETDDNEAPTFSMPLPSVNVERTPQPDCGTAPRRSTRIRRPPDFTDFVLYD